MSNTDKQFEKITFWQLIEKTHIEIPIIQRDYAQGRKSQQKIREKFLQALCDALTKNPDELDFIYGSEENDFFQPLDGQQRLTTLFLLHWYIATKEGKLEEVVKAILGKFSYETRTSSREFCHELVKNSIDFNNLLPVNEEHQISDTIKDASWFVASWENDPTISAMLTMLDSIHQKFKDTSNLWDKLTNEENPTISFLYVKLENFGLSDDLYIKMNARGKQLTVFENFKSQFEKHIEDKKFETDDIALENKFSHKIDNIWTDLFWKHRGDDNLVDNEFVKFIVGIAINSYAENQEIFKSEDEDKITRKILEEKKEKNITDEAVKRERIERRITLLFNNPNKITPEDFPSKTSFEYLKSCFDMYSHKKLKYDELKPEELKLWDFLEIKKVKINSKQELENNLFLDLIKDAKTEYKQRVLFYAQTQFLLKAETFNSNSFTEWMRVVRNIVQNATIDSARPYIGAIGLIKELSSGSSDIYDFLSKNTIKSGFAKEQLKEEIEKAKIITTNPGNKSIIHETEDTNFCKGKIEFALYCVDYDINKPNPSYFKKESLGEIKTVFENHLKNDDVSNDFRRAFFTIGDNDFYEYWTSWLYAINAPKKKMITDINDLKDNFVFIKNEANNNQKYRDYLKELIIQLSKRNIDDVINDFIKSPKFSSPGFPNWKKIIIQKKDSLNRSEKHYIAIKTDESCCWLIPQSRVANDDEGRLLLCLIE